MSPVRAGPGCRQRTRRHADRRRGRRCRRCRQRRDRRPRCARRRCDALLGEPQCRSEKPDRSRARRCREGRDLRAGTNDQIRSVRFSIDGKVFSDETTAPFDLVTTRSNQNAIMFPTRLLTDGSHTVTARIVLKDGTVQMQSATFVTLNPRPAGRARMVSAAANRGNARRWTARACRDRSRSSCPPNPTY